MRNFDFYRTAALAVGAMLAASVALTSCKKDETTPAPITPETLKQLNELMREGYYGAVKSVTNTTYTNLKPTVPDSSDVDISAARPTQETKTEYNTAGYKTSKTVRRADYARNPTTGEYGYGELKPTEYSTYAYDDKNRKTEIKTINPPNEENCTNYGYMCGDTSRTTYDYTSVPGKCVAIEYYGSSEQERIKTIYDLDADGYMDEGNYKQYEAVPNAFETNPNEVYITKRDKDAAGNTTSTRTLQITLFCVQGIWDDNDNYVCQRYMKNVNCYYTKQDISYY